MQKTISSRRKWLNSVGAFMTVTALAWWVWSHPTVDYFFFGISDEMPSLRWFDYMILILIPTLFVWNIIEWLKK